MTVKKNNDRILLYLMSINSLLKRACGEKPYALFRTKFQKNTKFSKIISCYCKICTIMLAIEFNLMRWC